MPSSYRSIIETFSSRGFRQVDLVVRATPVAGRLGSGRWRGGGAAVAQAAALNAAAAPGFEAMRDLWEKSMLGRMPMGTDVARAWEASIGTLQGGRFEGAGSGPLGSPGALLERLMQDALAGAGWQGGGAVAAGASAGGGGSGGAGGGFASGGGSGVSDADLMRLLRRLNGPGGGEADNTALASPRARRGAPAPGFAGLPADADGAAQSMFGGLMATNLIRAHHDELVQASPGQLDHMVIEVVASLFDQILADSRVPPQIAREIARLQLPVLRVALRDTSFFSSRKHPVRRFINRISTLATGFGNLEQRPGRDLLARVNALVTEIVEGDFDQVPLYARKLGELEQFVAARAQAEFERSPAAATLQAKEAEWEIGAALRWPPA